MYDSKTAHRWPNWDGMYNGLEYDCWDWMINTRYEQEIAITTGDHQKYHAKRIENAERRELAQKRRQTYTADQVAQDPFGHLAAKPGTDRSSARARYHRWSQEQKELLGKMSDRDVSNIVGVSIGAVITKRRDMGIKVFKEREK